MVIDPAAHTAELDCFNQMAVSSPVPLTYHLPALHGLTSLHRDEPGALGIIVLGSSSSVNERLAWQQQLGEWLLARMQQKLPTLGLCFGHQLVAHLFGGQIDFLYPDKAKLVGFQLTSLKPNPLWDNQALDGPLYVSHREVVTSCPADMTVIATRPDMPFDGFAHDELPIWTVQAHPEATPGFARGESAGLDGDPQQFEFGHALVQRFLSFAATTR